MAMAFDYLLDKLADAEFRSDPFRHIWIDDLFTSEHFAAITAAPEQAGLGELCRLRRCGPRLADTAKVGSGPMDSIGDAADPRVIRNRLKGGKR
jgi:hypothetical protein